MIRTLRVHLERRDLLPADIERPEAAIRKRAGGRAPLGDWLAGDANPLTRAIGQQGRHRG